MHVAVCVRTIGDLFVLCRILRKEEICVSLCDPEWQKGRRWGLHPKKGFLSRWQLGDWQDAILFGNSVSQPVSLPVRQPLTPLNLAFCWAVTGLALTLHVASPINCTMKPTHARWELASMNSLWHNTVTGSPFDGINDKNSFVFPAFSLSISLSHHKHPHPPPSNHCSGFYYVGSIFWVVEHKLRQKNSVRSLCCFGNDYFCLCVSD